MPLAGSLHQIALADVLRVIENGQRSGVLVVTHADLQANIYFSAGQWVAAERVGATQVLAQQFVRAGLITQDDFEAVFGVTFAQAGAIPDVQVVRGLIGARVITPEQLRAFAAHDASALLSVLLTWTDGEFAFEDGVALPQGRIAIPLPIAPLVAQAMRQARLPAGGTAAAAYRETPQLEADAILDFEDVDPRSGAAIKVTRDQWHLLTAIDGQTPLWAIAEQLQAPLHIVLSLASRLVADRLAVVVGHADEAALPAY